MESDVFIAEKSFLINLQHIISQKPNSIALIGEKGYGKFYAACFMASKFLGTEKSKLPANSNFITLDANQTGIEEVRSLQNELSLSVPGDREIRRVVVIERFNKFRHEAQNAMLKTLEEPPISTVLILTIDNPNDVLPTILSRVQTLNLKPISFQTAAKFLPNTPESELKRAHLMSGGSAGLLISLINNDEGQELVPAVLKAKELLQMQKFKRIALVEQITKKPEIPVSELVDAVVRVLEASYSQAIHNNGSEEVIRTACNRLEVAVNTLEDINSGINQKLALTRLFLAL